MASVDEFCRKSGTNIDEMDAFRDEFEEQLCEFIILLFVANERNVRYSVEGVHIEFVHVLERSVDSKVG